VAAGPEREEVPHHLQVDLRRRLHFPGADAAVHGRDLGARRGTWLLARDGALLSCLRAGGGEEKMFINGNKKTQLFFFHYLDSKKKQVVFPIECWIKVFKPRKGMCIILRVLSVICAIISAVCVVASVKELGTEAKEFKLLSA
jgi:hypothetical protein